MAEALIMLRIVRWEIILDYLAGPNVVTSVQQEDQRRRRDNESRSKRPGATHKGMQAAVGS